MSADADLEKGSQFSDESSDEEGSDLFAPGQPTEANGLAGGSAKLSASTDLKKILQGHRTKRVNASPRSVTLSISDARPKPPRMRFTQRKSFGAD